MSNKTTILQHPDQLILEESNKNLCLIIFFKDKQKSLSINLQHSDINYLSTELNLIKQKHLIAAEYQK